MYVKYPEHKKISAIQMYITGKTVKEICYFLDVEYRTVYRWIRPYKIRAESIQYCKWATRYLSTTKEPGFIEAYFESILERV